MPTDPPNHPTSGQAPPSKAGPEEPRGIVLVGFMGAGKSSVGRYLARRLQLPFVDTDAEIERTTRRSIREIFQSEGEPVFRDIETATLRNLDAQPRVYSTGGGVVIRDENWPLLRRLGKIVYLEAPPAVLFDRVKKHSHRPLLQTPDPWASFHSLFDQRRTLYEMADYIVRTEGMTPPIVADRIEALFKHPR